MSVTLGATPAIRPAERVSVAADDSRHMRTVAVKVVLSTAANSSDRGSSEVLMVDDARVSVGVPQVGMAVVDAAINHRDANTRSVVTGVHGRVDLRRCSDSRPSVHRMVDGNRSDLRIGLQRSQGAHRNGEGGTLDHV